MNRLCDDLWTGTLHSPGFMLCLLLHTSNDGIREYFFPYYVIHLSSEETASSAFRSINNITNLADMCIKKIVMVSCGNILKSSKH